MGSALSQGCLTGERMRNPGKVVRNARRRPECRAMARRTRTPLRWGSQARRHGRTPRRVHHAAYRADANPRLVHEIGEPDLASSMPLVLDPGHDHVSIVIEKLRVQVLFIR